jgi:hypothetical protein
MIGMNWEPTPSNYTSLPAPTQYGDTDFANDDFVALWNLDSNNVGRHDLLVMQQMNVNTVKMYNWSVPAPNGYWMRNHVNFLKLAGQLGLSVIVPISNYFTGMAYNQRTGNSNPGGPQYTSGVDLQQWMLDIVTEIYQGGAPGPVIMWAIGNEFDNSAVGAYGYCEAQDIAQIASYIVAAEATLGISQANVLAFTSPVTTAITPINPSIPSNNPPYNTLMGGCAIDALIQAFNTALGASVTTSRFLASVNSYQIGQQLADYNAQFPQVFPGLTFFYGELGFSAAGAGGDTTQQQNVSNQFTEIVGFATPGSPFYGACCFEYSDELWKGPPNSSETMFGLYTFSGTLIGTSTEGNHAPVWGASYPVDQFTPRPAADWFLSDWTVNPWPLRGASR